MEKEVYQDHHFIKHIPVPERYKHILSLVRSGSKYYENDYKAFESHFTPEILNTIECELYKYLLSKYSADADYICRVITGENRLHTQAGVNCTVTGRRMSGDMCTSLGNGFTNLMLFLYICHKKKMWGDGYVEGDDGIFATQADLTAQDFAELGFTVEIKELSHPSRGHFCGMTFPENGQNIKDPRKVFETFGWTSSFIHAGSTVMDELLRSKALSLAYEMPQCPILGALSRRALELTMGIEVKHTEDKWGQRWDVILKTPVPLFEPALETRQLFQELFNISVEAQIMAEDYIYSDRLDLLSQLIPAPRDVAHYTARYVEAR